MWWLAQDVINTWQSTGPTSSMKKGWLCRNFWWLIFWYADQIIRRWWQQLWWRLYDSVMMTMRWRPDQMCWWLCRERIPSYLRGSVDVFVTSKDIMMYIIIVCCCTHIKDVFPSFRVSIIMYGPWGKTSIVSQGSSPEFNIMKCIFGVSLG